MYRNRFLSESVGFCYYKSVEILIEMALGFLKVGKGWKGEGGGGE